MWMMPLHLHVNQKADYDMIITTMPLDSILSLLSLFYTPKFCVCLCLISHEPVTPGLQHESGLPTVLYWLLLQVQSSTYHDCAFFAMMLVEQYHVFKWEFTDNITVEHKERFRIFSKILSCQGKWTS